MLVPWRVTLSPFLSKAAKYSKMWWSNGPQLATVRTRTALPWSSSRAFSNWPFWDAWSGRNVGSTKHCYKLGHGQPKYHQHFPNSSYTFLMKSEELDEFLVGIFQWLQSFLGISLSSVIFFPLRLVALCGLFFCWDNVSISTYEYQGGSGSYLSLESSFLPKEVHIISFLKTTILLKNVENRNIPEFTTYCVPISWVTTWLHDMQPIPHSSTPRNSWMKDGPLHIFCVYANLIHSKKDQLLILDLRMFGGWKKWHKYSYQMVV